MEGAVEFYTQVLGFERVDDREVIGENHERLYGVFGLRLHTTRRKLGDEYIELMEFLAPADDLNPSVVIKASDYGALYLRRVSSYASSSGPGGNVQDPIPSRHWDQMRGWLRICIGVRIQSAYESDRI